MDVGGLRVVLIDDYISASGPQTAPRDRKFMRDV